jgi:hypothetical protein
MNTLTIESAAKFMAKNPTVLTTTVNRMGQLVTFFEHPTQGDEAPVYAAIGDRLANTGFYDLDDMLDQCIGYDDYVPMLHNDKIVFVCDVYSN